MPRCRAIHGCHAGGMPARGGGPLPAPPPARARDDRVPLSPSVSGGQLQRAMTPMAMSCRRPDRLRRADHGARRHHPDPGAGGHQGHRAPVHTAAIYITHDLADGADGRPHHGPALRRSRGGGADAPDALQPTEGLHEILVGRALPAEGRIARRRYAASRRTCRCRLRRRAHGVEGREHRRAARPHGRRGRGIRLRQDDVGARHHRLAAAVERRGGSTMARRCRRRSRAARRICCGACR